MLIHQYFRENVRFVQYVCFLHFLTVFLQACWSDNFRNISRFFKFPLLLLYHFSFYIHMRCVYILCSLYFKTFMASFLITFRAPEISVSINRDVPISLLLILMSVVFCQGGFSLFALDSVICLSHLQRLFLLILLHSHTSVPYLIIYFLACVQVH